MIDEYVAAGVERVVFNVPSAEREKVLPLLDKLAGLIDHRES